MADVEMYDYLDTVTPDNDVTLSVTPQEVVVEEGSMNQEVRLFDDGSEEVVTLSTKKVFYVTLTFPRKQSSDIGIIMDFYFDPNKGNGVASSFKWQHPTDGHTYVVKFRDPFKRSVKRAMQSVTQVLSLIHI